MAAEMTDLMTGAVDQFIRIGPQPETRQEPAREPEAQS
jgi:hypothetical protein